PGEIVVDTEGGASLFYIKGHDPEKISRLVAKFQASPTANAIFVTARRPANGCSPGAVKGFAPGTFALEFAGQCLISHGPDMIVTYRWDDAANPFGVPGTQWIPGGPAPGQQEPHNGHGGLNPYVTHSTLFAAGRDFAQGKAIDVPAGNQDIAPTLLAMQGLPVPASLDGRVLSEALKNPTKARRLKSSTGRIEVSAGSYCAQLEVSYAGDHVYLNQARRCAAKP
ncbi:MAG TPA: hypothetical protein VGJ21_26080, partial [Terracidiphilus sp.]